MRWAYWRMGAKGSRLDAELLVAHLLGCDRDALLLGRRDAPVDEERLAALVERRVGGEPIAYITGRREFWSLDFLVTRDTLIPRADSETLIEAALAHRAEAKRESVPESASPRLRVLDMGTGSGCLLLAALSEWPGAWGLGVDRSEAAVRVAQLNAQRLGLAERAAFVVADWGEPLGGRFDAILANPPYVGCGESLAGDVVRFEPARALFAGAEGLDAYRALLPQLGPLLAPGGAVHLEIGFEQADLVGAIASDHGFATSLRFDLAGHPRCLTLTPRPTGLPVDSPGDGLRRHSGRAATR